MDISNLSKPLTLSLKSLRQISRASVKKNDPEWVYQSQSRLPKTLPQTTVNPIIIERNTPIDLPDNLQSRLQQQDEMLQNHDQTLKDTNRTLQTHDQTLKDVSRTLHTHTQTLVTHDENLTQVQKTLQQVTPQLQTQTASLTAHEQTLRLLPHMVQDIQDKMRDLEDDQNVMRLEVQSTRQDNDKQSGELLQAMEALKNSFSQQQTQLLQAVAQSSQQIQQQLTQQKQLSVKLSEDVKKQDEETRKVVKDLTDLCTQLQQKDHETLSHIKALKAYTEEEVKTIRQNLQTQDQVLGKNYQGLQDNIETLKSKYQQVHAIMLNSLESVEKRNEASAETAYSQMKEEAKKLEELYRQQQDAYQNHDSTIHTKLEQMEQQLRQRLQQMESQINVLKSVDLGNPTETPSRATMKNVAEKIRKTSQNALS